MSNGYKHRPKILIVSTAVIFSSFLIGVCIAPFEPSFSKDRRVCFFRDVEVRVEDNQRISFINHSGENVFVSASVMVSSADHQKPLICYVFKCLDFGIGLAPKGKYTISKNFVPFAARYDDSLGQEAWNVCSIRDVAIAVCGKGITVYDGKDLETGKDIDCIWSTQHPLQPVKLVQNSFMARSN